MEVMRFAEKQKKITIYEIEDGARDVIICTNERKVTEKNPNDGAESATMYEYDGNIFRTYLVSADEINENPESFLTYGGDEPPTDAMVEYANQKIDEYTAQLMEEGVI